MDAHVYDKAALIRRLDLYLKKTLGEIDNLGIFENVKQYSLQKGIAGTVVEQCLFGYAPDQAQRPDLVIIDGPNEIQTELKTTGVIINNSPRPHYVAKETMSITAVGIYDISEQVFETSHFWNKLEHLLLVYYHYNATDRVEAYAYKDFPIVGFEFHEFSEDDKEILKNDWEHVRSLCAEVISHHPGERDKKWRQAVKEEYIEVHGKLRRLLSFIDLAPKFPPRFRLKQPTVSAIISKHFNYELSQLPGRYQTITDIDRKCRELTEQYKGLSIKQLAEHFNIKYDSNKSNKAISERITIAMFGGKASSLNKVDIFAKFGLIAKSIVLSPTGGRTEDMKLYRVDFDEMTQTRYYDDEEGERDFLFEDSELYSYFLDHEFLCIIFKEPEYKNGADTGLDENIFVGFKRLVFSDEFIDTTVRAVWDDTRDKIMNNRLVDVVQHNKDGSIKYNKNGSLSSAPNFIKSKQNDVFLRGSNTDSSPRYKTESVNGIKMLPQYIWIKGTAVVEELEKAPEM